MIAKAALAVCLLPLIGLAQTIQFVDGVFKVAGWRPDRVVPSGGWSSIFAVYAGAEGAPPMLGTYSVEDGSLVFRPRFPLAAGVHYRAVFETPGVPRTEVSFDGAKRESVSSSKVVRVYPSADVLPSNALRMYIYFSAPMSRGEAWKHIRVLDERDKPIELPFLVIDQELWDPAYQRLTLLFDPGRIKRGLVLNQQMGPPIVEGRQYTLEIDRGWLDARGVPMVEGFRKTFRGGPSDRTPPYLNQWRVSAPRAGTVEALVIDFPKPMDYALMQRLIDIPDVAGSVDVDRQETQWRFTPSQPWKAGGYRLAVDSSLEDFAGNRIDRPFDVDNLQPSSGGSGEKTAFLPFQVH